MAQIDAELLRQASSPDCRWFAGTSVVVTSAIPLCALFDSTGFDAHFVGALFKR